MITAPLSPPTQPSQPTQSTQPIQRLNAADFRPLGTGELLDRGFTLYRQHLSPLLLLALLGQMIPFLCQTAATTLHLLTTKEDLFADPWINLERLGLLGALTLLGQLPAFLVDVVMTLFIARIYLGEATSLGECFQRCRGLWAGALWTALLNRLLLLLTVLFPLGALFGFYLILILLPSPTFLLLLLICAVTLVGIILSLVPVLLVLMRLMVTVPMVALERRFGWAAARRSSQLVRFDPGLGPLYWGEMRLSFLLLPLVVINLLIVSVSSLPYSVQRLLDAFHQGAESLMSVPQTSTLIITQVITLLAGSFLLPLYSIVTVLFYYDVRIRKEGFDIEYLAQALTRQPQPV